MKLFEEKIYNNKSKKIAGAFDNGYNESKSGGIEELSMQQYL